MTYFISDKTAKEWEKEDRIKAEIGKLIIEYGYSAVRRASLELLKETQSD